MDDEPTQPRLEGVADRAGQGAGRAPGALRHAEHVDAQAWALRGLLHETRNFLSAVSLLGHLVATDDRLPQDVRDDTRALIARATALETLVDHVDRFSGPGARTIRPASLATVVGSVTALAAVNLRQRGVAIDVRIPVDLPDVDVDAADVRDLLAVLVRNSADAFRETGRHGSVTITAETVDGSAEARARITVADDGPGLSDEARAFLFEPFRTTREGHLGLGLAVARSIAVGAGGSLREATADGSPGAVFVVELPAAREPSGRPAPGDRHAAKRASADPDAPQSAG